MVCATILAGDSVIIMLLLGYLSWGVKAILCPQNHTNIIPYQGRIEEDQLVG